MFMFIIVLQRRALRAGIGLDYDEGYGSVFRSEREIFVFYVSFYEF